MNSAASDAPSPVSLANEGDALVIEWSDGARHRLTWKLLRDACPCATCNDQRRKSASVGDAPADRKQADGDLPVLSLEEARPLRPTAMRPVGNYAYGIHFSDGHSTGIYTLAFLRELGERTEA